MCRGARRACRIALLRVLLLVFHRRLLEGIGVSQVNVGYIGRQDVIRSCGY